LSKRQFERTFKNAIGISPKLFSRIIKFKNSVNYLRSSSTNSLYNVAIDCGYYDHSHLIKDFKEFGGTLPNEVT
jgi:Transcriptional regulator containing an amidase domain and an AraC-type DNA-binding HTH domain